MRVVSIGGGTGLSNLLHGLKVYTPQAASPPPGCDARVDITAVVTVTDDGGSSGRLRRDFKVLPPGDIRNCMVALSEDEGLLSQLFQYRFEDGHGLKGHSFGNLFLTALTKVTGDFKQAVKVSSDVLAIMGRIYPSTAVNVSLEARLANGATVVGETKISKSRSRIESIALNPRQCSPLPETLLALAEADLITFGPGSLFTSVIPNLLVDGIPEAIERSPAIKAYFVNLMWQPGETMHFTAADHVEAIQTHARRKLLDVAVVNRQPINAPLRNKYARREALPVEIDIDRLASLGVAVLERDLLLETHKIRHNPEAIAAVAVELALQARAKREKRKATTTT